MKKKQWLAAGCGSEDTRAIVWHSGESSKIVKQVMSDTSLTKEQQEFI